MQSKDCIIWWQWEEKKKLQYSRNNQDDKYNELKTEPVQNEDEDEEEN